MRGRLSAGAEAEAARGARPDAAEAEARCRRAGGGLRQMKDTEGGGGGGGGRGGGEEGMVLAEVGVLPAD